MPRLFVALLLTALVAPLATAQINTEQLRKDVAPGTHLQFDLSGGFASGNTDFLRLSLGARVDLVGERASAFSVGRYELSEVDDVIDVRNAFVHARVNRPLAPRLIGEVFGQVERNDQTLLEQRYLLGGGVRYEILEREAVGLAFGSTPMFEYERLGDAAMEDPISTIRWSNYASVRVDVSETAEAFGVVYVQPRFDAFDDVRLLHESRLDVQMTERFKIRLRASTRHDSDPPLGVEATDVALTTGFVYTRIGG